MIALWTEIIVRTETAYSKRIEEGKASGFSSSGANIFEAKDRVIELYHLNGQRFGVPENMEVTAVYSTWYQPTLHHENITKFRTLDVKPTGTGVTLEAQSVEGEDAQINLRVHMICEVQPKRQST